MLYQHTPYFQEDLPENGRQPFQIAKELALVQNALPVNLQQSFKLLLVLVSGPLNS